MYVGLSLTSSSIFQMLRGSVVIFTATFSAVFLKKRQAGYKWLGVAFVLVGTAVVGASSFVSACKDSCAGASSGGGDSKAMIGNVLIIVAQVIVATQMVVEEMFIEGYDIPPLQVVGWEGLFGVSIMSTVLLAMYYIPVVGTPLCDNSVRNSGPNTTFSGTGGCPAPKVIFPATPACNHVEDVIDAFTQMGNAPLILLFTLLNMCSIAFFNFFGVSVTKYVNSATRMVLDSLRTMVIWGFSLGIGWEKFCYVQVIGFVVLLAGTFIFNGILRVPGFVYEEPAQAVEGREDAEAALLQEGMHYDTLETSSLNLNSENVYSVSGQACCSRTAAAAALGAHSPPLHRLLPHAPPPHTPHTLPALQIKKMGGAR